MDTELFEHIASEEFARVPERFAARLKNVALLVENEPNEVTRKEEGLTSGTTLLGLYRGVPLNARGDGYGVGATVPDTITLYKMPILAYAAAKSHSGQADEPAVRLAVRETIWHEIGHAFGLDEPSVDEREDEGTNYFHKTQAQKKE